VRNRWSWICLATSVLLGCGGTSAPRESQDVTPAVTLPGCAGGLAATPEGTCEPGHRVVATVSGLAGSGLVLQVNGGEGVAVGADGQVAFPDALARGASYVMTVARQPASPSQTCTVSASSGRIADADVTVAVTCATNRYLVRAAVTGLSGSTGLVLRDLAGTELRFDGDGALEFPPLLASGSAYEVGVASQPTPLRHCDVEGGRGTVDDRDVTVTVSCATPIVQKWEAPARWGARWPDGPTLVQHATFDGARLVEDEAIDWSVVGGAAPAQNLVAAFGAGARWAAGPFEGARYQATSGDAVLDERLKRDMLVCAVVRPDYHPSVPEGDMLDKVIAAKGVAGRSGWVLMQMHDMFCFHYEDSQSGTQMIYTPTYFADANKPRNGPLNPSYVVVCAGRDGNQLITAANGYPDAEAKAWDATVTGELVAGATPRPLTIGNDADGRPEHAFGGRVYEVAIWAEPATRANIEAKMAAFHGLPSGARYTRNREGPFDFTGGTLDGELHTAWRHGPRVDPARGMLFGLQGWNRVSFAAPSLYDDQDMTIGQRNPIVAAGEDLSGKDPAGADLWARSPGAAVARDPAVRPPGDSGQAFADRVTLQPGASLSRSLGTFDAPGPIHGMLWLRSAAAQGTLTLRTTRPAPGTTSRATIELSALRPGWNRIWLQGLTTDGSATGATLSLENDGLAAIDLHAWGLDLTQLGGGGDLGAFDPGAAMYDWGAGDDLAMSGHGRSPVDVLELARVPLGTGGGFCLGVEAQPPAGLRWDAPLARDRTLVAWVNDAGNANVRLAMEGAASRGASPRRLCLTGSVGTVCGEPSGWAPGSRHAVTACASSAGARLYLDGALAGSTSAAAPPDLASGHLLVGNGATPAAHASSTPWHGFVSKVVACRDAGAPAACR
jgi:hypothetical protein